MVDGHAAALENFYTADYQMIDRDGQIHNKRKQVELMTKSIDLVNVKSEDVHAGLPSKNVRLITAG